MTAMKMIVIQKLKLRVYIGFPATSRHRLRFERNVNGSLPHGRGSLMSSLALFEIDAILPEFAAGQRRKVRHLGGQLLAQRRGVDQPAAFQQVEEDLAVRPPVAGRGPAPADR